MDMTYSLHNSRSYSHWFDDRRSPLIAGFFFAPIVAVQEY
jgi:hypothetical protein